MQSCLELGFAAFSLVFLHCKWIAEVQELQKQLHVNCHKKETIAVTESWNAQVSSNYYISYTKNNTVAVCTWKTEREANTNFFVVGIYIMIVHLLQAA